MSARLRLGSKVESRKIEEDAKWAWYLVIKMGSIRTLYVCVYNAQKPKQKPNKATTTTEKE